MITIHNINLDQLMQILSSIRVDTDTVDMEVDDVEKTIVFVPVKKEGKEDDDKSDMLDITDRIKKMKEEFEANKSDTAKQVEEISKTNLKDLNKLI